MLMHAEAEMSITELLQRAEFLVDAKGTKKAVILDYAIWDELLTMLEDLEDADEIRRLRKVCEEEIPWEEAKTNLRAEGVKAGV